MTIPDVGVTALGLLADSALTFDNPTTAIRAAALEAALAARPIHPTAETLVAAARVFEAYLSAPATPAGLNDAERAGLAELLESLVERNETSATDRLARYAALLRGGVVG